MKTNIFILFFSFAISITSCSKAQNSTRNAGIFTVLQGDTILQIDGVINKHSLTNFNKLHMQYPDLRTISIVNCDGSKDDEVNLQLSFKIHELQLNTHLQENGLIASGGVDLFLAGINRSCGENTLIGVHSWSSLFKQATDFPIGHENHQPYIDYYISIGFTKQESEEFYYFTINSASARDIYWMTEEEIQEYNIITE